MTLREALHEQRLDDHRFYHHSRVNQSLHLVSALCFLTAYLYLLINPIVSVLMGWLVAMCSRQIGHFFFEPRGFDTVNAVSHDHKEHIKVGYNLRRKLVLLSIWVLTPPLLALAPGLFGLIEPHTNLYEFIYHLCALWLCVAAGGLVFRTVQLFFIRDMTTGLVWFIKILTDPFNDVRLYYKSPFYLLKGEWIDPMYDVQQARQAAADLRGQERA